MEHENKLTWHWYRFTELSTSDLYDVLTLRQQVFVVEQNCVYLDCDASDQFAHHLLCRENSRQQLVAYLRLLPPQQSGPAHIGRVVTHRSVRGAGVGKALVVKGITRCRDYYPHSTLRISAQHHLEHFYGEFGFQTTSAPYDEDGIPHIRMELFTATDLNSRTPV